MRMYGSGLVGHFALAARAAKEGGQLWLHFVGALNTERALCCNSAQLTRLLTLHRSPPPAYLP